MPFAFIRPVDTSLLDGRPLLDVGCGDGQTVLAVAGGGGVVGVDRSVRALGAAARTGILAVAGDARRLPIADAAMGTVLAADLFHHLEDDDLTLVSAEAHRVLRPGGRFVAWWYEAPGRGGAGDPRYPRGHDEAITLVRRGGFGSVGALELQAGLEPTPPTVGLTATR